jgi:hypothetical protein
MKKAMKRNSRELAWRYLWILGANESHRFEKRMMIAPSEKAPQTAPIMNA